MSSTKAKEKPVAIKKSQQFFVPISLKVGSDKKKNYYLNLNGYR